MAVMIDHFGANPLTMVILRHMRKFAASLQVVFGINLRKLSGFDFP